MIVVEEGNDFGLLPFFFFLIHCFQLLLTQRHIFTLLWIMNLKMIPMRGYLRTTNLKGAIVKYL